MPPPPFRLCLLVKEQNQWRQVTEICQTLDGFCSLWPGTDLRGYDEGYAFSHKSFSKSVFDVYNFSIISNFFDSDKPYVKSTHIFYLIENLQTKCIIFGEALKNRVKKFTQNLPENYSKSTKITKAACKFSGGACPCTPLHFFVSQSA